MLQLFDASTEFSIEDKVVDASTGFKLSQCRVELMSLVDTTFLNTQTTLYGNFHFMAFKIRANI
ncbi:MAG TPA: hypothetical protein DCF44_07325 [Chitinophagaceae bacterium]|nr:hypothetical protein [Chitinophagaceae bacterium]